MKPTKLQQALASLSHEEAMVVWHALAAYTENAREAVEIDPAGVRDLGLAESALSMMEVAVAEMALLPAALEPCPACKPPEGRVNHVVGHIFVGWGVGWQPCTHCGGSGLAT